MAGLREWSCPRCTFINDSSNEACDMCECGRSSIDIGSSNQESNGKRKFESTSQPGKRKARTGSVALDANASSSSIPIVSMTHSSKLTLPRRSVPPLSRPHSGIATIITNTLDRKQAASPEGANTAKKSKAIVPPCNERSPTNGKVRKEASKNTRTDKKPSETEVTTDVNNNKEKDKPSTKSNASTKTSPTSRDDSKKNTKSVKVPNKRKKKLETKPINAAKNTPKPTKKATRAEEDANVGESTSSYATGPTVVAEEPIPDATSSIETTVVDSIGGESIADSLGEPVVSAVGPGCTDMNSGLPKDFFVWGNAGIEARKVDVYNELVRHGWEYRQDVLSSERKDHNNSSSSSNGGGVECVGGADDGVYVTPAMRCMETAVVQINYVEGKDFFYSLSEVLEYVRRVICRTTMLESDEGSLTVERITPESDKDELLMIARDGIGSVTGTNYFASKLEHLLNNKVSAKHFIGAVIRDPDSGCIIGMAFGSVTVLKRKKNGKVMEGNIDGLWVAPSNGGAHLGFTFASWFENLVKLTAYSLSIYEGVCEVYTSVLLARGEDVATFWRKVGYTMAIGGSPLASKDIDLNIFTDDTVFWPQNIE